MPPLRPLLSSKVECYLRRTTNSPAAAPLINHLIQEHPALPLTDEQVSEMVATRSYYLEYQLVDMGGTASEEEKFGPEPY
jgi:hypothetical protein